MRYLGRHQIGDSVPLGIQCVTPAGVPTMPDSAPVALIYTAAGAAVGSSVSLPIHDRRGHDTAGTLGAFFLKRELLGSNYATDTRYVVIYQFIISAVTYHEAALFETLAGGDADGTVVGLDGVGLPDAEYVLYETESGNLVKGRGPE